MPPPHWALQVISAVEEGVREMGYNEFSLLSLSCSDYLALPSVGLEIKNRLKNENVTLSLPRSPPPPHPPYEGTATRTPCGTCRAGGP